MAKSKKPRQVKKLTKKQLSRRKREQQQLRWIWIGVGALSVLVVILVAVGLISQSRQAVAWVNGQRIRVADYQKRVRFQYHFYNGYLAPGYFDRLEPEQQTQFYRGVAEQLVEETLILQEVEKQGVSVTDEEVQIEIEETWFQHYRVPPTPTPSPTPDPQATPTQAGTPQPTPTPDTEEAFTTRYNEFVENVLKPARLDESYFRDLVRASLLGEKLQVAMVPDVPAEEDQVNFRYARAQDDEEARKKIEDFFKGVSDQAHVRHILVETQEEAEAVLKRLDAGEDFVALAAELSTDSSNKDDGGDLGWFGRGRMVPEFEAAAFESEVGLLSSPVQTQFGYHIIEVLGREERAIDLSEEMIEAGWQGKKQIADRFGDQFAEVVFNVESGLFSDPVPADFGVAVVEVLGRQVRPLDEIEQDQRRADLFQSRLDEIRQEGDIQDLWEASMIPRRM
jgi:parvulin-like peptidyl-prolyl isomerase